MDWNNMANLCGLDRWRLYHWFFETFQRLLRGPMEKEDVAKMREMIKQALENDLALDKQYQTQIKSSLSKQYHRSSFSIAFNNTKRQLMKELGKQELTGKVVGARSSGARVHKSTSEPAASNVTSTQSQGKASQHGRVIPITSIQQVKSTQDSVNVQNVPQINGEQDNISVTQSSFITSQLNDEDSEDSIPFRSIFQETTEKSSQFTSITSSFAL